MRVSLKWLQEFFAEKLDPKTIADQLTFAGLEIEAIEEQGKGLDQVVVAKILEKIQHPDADRLSLCQVNNGQEILAIVCGAQNMKAGDKVALAQIGAVLPGDFKIKKSKIRGQESFGMLCSASELGLAEVGEGIIILDEGAELGRPLAEHFGLDDTVLEINITPNRGDCLSVLGIVREISAVTGYKIQKILHEKNFTEQFANPFSIEIEDAKKCLRYCSRVIKNVKVQESPIEIQEKLKASGIRPINNIVDATNLVMLETGHPLHAFDMEKILGNKIFVRSAKDKEKLKTLDDQERELSSDELVISDQKHSLALAGIMGGLDSSITESSQTLLLESASFDPATIRKSSKRVVLNTDSSYRFERWVDVNSVDFALDRLTEVICQFNSKAEVSQIADLYPEKLLNKKILFRPSYFAKVIGLEVGLEEVKKHFSALHFFCEEKSSYLEVEVPSFRSDIEREIDLVEELARLIGYDKVPVTYPCISLNDLKSSQHNYINSVKTKLCNLGFFEAINYSFTSAEAISKWNWREGPGLNLVNPISEELAVMRPTLISSLVANLRHNLSHGEGDIKLFEIRPVYLLKDEKIEESLFSCLLVSGHRALRHFQEKNIEVDFYYMKGLVQKLLPEALFKTLEIKPSNFKFLHDYQQGEIFVQKKKIGILGTLHPRICKNEDLSEKTIICEFDIGVVNSLQSKLKSRRFRDYSTFPSIKRDLNLIVDESLNHGEIEQFILNCKMPWLSQLEVFDLYQGKPIPDGKKALTYSIEYASLERTLRDDEVNQVHEDLIAKLGSSLGATLR